MKRGTCLFMALALIVGCRNPEASSEKSAQKIEHPQVKVESLNAPPDFPIAKSYECVKPDMALHISFTNQLEDSLVGEHIFTTQNGNRIDACMDEEAPSIFLHRVRPNFYEGTMKSCYDIGPDTYQLQLTNLKDSIRVVRWLPDIRPDTIIFYPENPHKL